ncbi:Holliday junction recognition protein [Orycteropus afer afer]|uniref:Holliday junction recognition protein n=1 Tax=Orycteropus afer afer TaxID=1230840 RepID=A0A8B7A1R2_ORYAF|nr:Holliday junction recognition protein [Orycteropus afer afer]
MADDLSEEAELMRQLQDSRRRFQRRMQQLIDKYNQPFEDAPLVEMATLTYRTPQGLRLWGGQLLREGSRERMQLEESPVRLMSWGNGPGRAAATGSKSNDVDAALDQGDKVAMAMAPAVPQSPLKNELRRKYLTRVDDLLQGKGWSECTYYSGGEDAQVTLSPTLAEPAWGDNGDVFVKKPGGPVRSASPLGECEPSADLAVVPGNASHHSLVSHQSLEAEDVCDVTISDLYEGMLHSMSQLLGTKPSCVISTKTLITRPWSCRWRPRWRARLNRTYCKGGSSEERRSPCSEPTEKMAAPSSTESSLGVPGRESRFQLKKALQEVNHPQGRGLAPGWKELSVTPRKRSPVMCLDSSAVYDLDQENRFMTLKWLISPVKITCKSRAHQGLARSCHREIDVKFDKLHQECCPYPVSRTCPPGFWALDLCRGSPASPSCLQETHQLRIPAPQRPLEGLEELGERSVGKGGCSPKYDSFSALCKTGLGPNPDHAEWPPACLLQGGSPAVFRSLPPREAISKPSVQPLGCGRSRYDDIKERFDRLHQEYCQTSPRRVTESSCTGLSPTRASVEALRKKDFRGHMGADSAVQSPQKSFGSTTTEIYLATGVVRTPWRDHQSPAKRRRLSDPQVCGQWAESWNSTGAGRADLRLRGVFRPL